MTEKLKIEDIFCNLPDLETNRLLLRKLTLDDAEDVFEYASEPDVAFYVTWEHHKSIEDSIQFLSESVKKYEEEKVMGWGIELKENCKLIGACGYMWWCPENARAEVGYALSKDYWNQGIMTEVLGEVIKFGFEKMKLNRIEARTRVENIASQSVLKKAGMTYEGTMRAQSFIKNQFLDFTIYSILKKEYF